MTDPTAPSELTYQERATWGECPVCHAKPGEWCDGTQGIALGLNTHGDPPEHGAHLGRLQRAPKRVRMVACD